MFNFFKKKQSDSSKDNFGNFQNNFNDEQKASILASLFIVANSDGHLDSKEMNLIDLTGKVLGVQSGDPILTKVISAGENEIIRILNTLNKSQKEWYIITLHSMIYADGKIEDIEVGYALNFAENIGISEDEYIKIIEKAEYILKQFKL